LIALLCQATEEEVISLMITHPSIITVFGKLQHQGIPR